MIICLMVRDWERFRVRSLMFFFFQAEDGIRDDLVTGVQTCALPISRSPPPAATGPAPAAHLPAGPARCRTRRDIRRWMEIERSEERRVGKECRSRWSQYH